MGKWKTQKARFPLSHRARYQKPKHTTRERTEPKRRAACGPPSSMKNRRPPPQFLIVATPQF